MSFNPEELSEEQLLQLLEGRRKASKSKTSMKSNLSSLPSLQSGEITKCLYKPLRRNQVECVNKPVTNWGYCSKHSRTSQSVAARKEYEDAEAVLLEALQSQEQMAPKSSREQFQEDLDSTFDDEEDLDSTFDEEDVDINDILGQRSKTTSEEITNKLKSKKKRKKRIPKNYWGNYEDPDTHIVFHPATSKAFGVQKANGKVVPLSPEHVLICKRYGWKYEEIIDSDEESELEEEEGSEIEEEEDIEDSDEEDSELEEEYDSEIEDEESEEGEEEEEEEDSDEYENDDSDDDDDDSEGEYGDEYY